MGTAKIFFQSDEYIIHPIYIQKVFCKCKFTIEYKITEMEYALLVLSLVNILKTLTASVVPY